MNISANERITIETEWPARIAVEQIREGSLMVSVHQVGIEAKKSWDGQIILLLKKESTLGLFVARYPDSEPPEWWRDAEIIYEFRQPRAKESEDAKPSRTNQ